MSTTTYSVGEVSARTGFSVDTLRYYERLGLIEPVERSVGGRRRYREEDVGWLDFVSCLRDTGMPVERMRQFAELCRDGEHTVPERVDLLAAHGHRVEAEIESLRTKLEAIRHKIQYYEGVLALRDGQGPDQGSADQGGPEAGEPSEEGRRA
ncbi:MerR family transcriptional regulator [Actinocrinis sp.]|uniref:MerR family transcriptional regulator n=1 Tax=Actinocrinis sp. TaxID=1920516 RepID=UPI002D490ED8|nr:MerR family transcriptional regulator [Actinocrinis sp.]HZP53212.1 MerR family transcriptional regulator [Actinocrinis sp.]